MHTPRKAAESIRVEDDFAYLLGFLPEGWREKARDLGALRRCRKIPDAEVLLRVLLIHLAEGCSLRETAVRARVGGLVELSDVAIMDRLRCSGDWFRWMNHGLMDRWVRRSPAAVYGPRWNVRLIDGTQVQEPGPTGTSWRIHYSIGLPSLACEELQICEPTGAGETFCNFTPHPGDLFIGDRAYGVRPGIFHVAGKGGEVLVRFALSNLPLWTPSGKTLRLLPRLRRLPMRQTGDWDALLQGKEGEEVAGRVIAIRKSRQATERACRHIKSRASRAGSTVKPETLEAAAYVCVFTTARREDLGATHALEMYRGRWQIEIVFKRLKSILTVGHLRKTDPESARSWLQGKLFVAFLVEALIRGGESFFPWGTPSKPAPFMRRRCKWREEQFMLNELQNAVTPHHGLRETIEGWHDIATGLRESPRKRNYQLEKLSRWADFLS